MSLEIILTILSFLGCLYFTHQIDEGNEHNIVFAFVSLFVGISCLLSLIGR